MNQKKLRKRYLLAAIILVTVILVAVFAVEYLTYTQTLTINPYHQFALGASSATWTVYQNDINQVQYVPGGDTQPTLDNTNINTYAFNITTDSHRVCSLEIQLATPLSYNDFSDFNITVLSWSGSWTSATLYTASTGVTTTPYLDGLASGASVYIHQPVSTPTTYYLVEATYSYNGTSTTPITVNFNYTPLPLTSF